MTPAAAARETPAVGTGRTADVPSWVLPAAYGVLALLLAIPMLVAEVPLGADTLNHIARIHVRANLAHDPDLQRLFAVREQLVPYMGLDWLLTPLAQVVPTLVASRIGIVLILWSTVGAAMLLRWTFSGRIGYEPLLVGLVSYNGLLVGGFLNYMVGVVGALVGLAAWHAARDRPWALRLVAGVVVAAALFFVHLLSLALYAFMVGAYEVFGRPRAWRTPVQDWLVLAAGFVPTALLWRALPLPPPVSEPGLHWLWDIKAIVLFSPVTFVPSGIGLGLSLAIVAICVVLGIGLTRQGVLSWDRRLAAPAIALMVAGLAVPTWALGVYLVDVRFPPVGAVLAASALRIAPGVGLRLLPVALLLAVAGVGQIGSVALAMHACDGQYNELRNALQELPRGVVLDAVAEEDAPVPGVACTASPITNHMAQLVTVDRSGYNPSFFANVTGIVVRGGLPADTYPTPAHKVTASTLPRHGHLLWIHMGNHRPLQPGMTLIHAGSFFDLFRVLTE